MSKTAAVGHVYAPEAEAVQAWCGAACRSRSCRQLRVSTPWPRNWLSKDGRLMMILGGSHITSWRNTTAYRGSCRTANRLSMDFEHRFLLHCGAMICQAPVCPMNVQFPSMLPCHSPCICMFDRSWTVRRSGIPRYRPSPMQHLKAK